MQRAWLALIFGILPVVLARADFDLGRMPTAQDVVAIRAMGWAAAADTLIVADGTSCRHQIHDGAQRDALHVARVLERALA